MRRTRHAFTLVELLVVLGIITLLMAILLPVLNHARRAARATVCLAHLSQLNASYQMYLSANHHHSIPIQIDITSLSWFEQLQPYNGSIQAMLLCPEATEQGNVVGGAFKAWGPERTYSVGSPKWTLRGEWTGSYGFNYWLYAPTADIRANAASAYLQKVIELPATQTDRVPVLGDCIESWAAPESDDAPPYDRNSPLPFYSGVGPKPEHGLSGQLGYFCLDRHFQAVNVAFLDGHAERVTLERLWKLRWNNTFTPRDVKLP